MWYCNSLLSIKNASRSSSLTCLIACIFCYFSAQLLIDDVPQTERQAIPIPKHLRVAPAPPIHECVHVEPSSKPFPKTTAGEVGWRSSDEKLKLDKYGRYCRPKGGLVKQLKWPNEAIGWYRRAASDVDLPTLRKVKTVQRLFRTACRITSQYRYF